MANDIRAQAAEFTKELEQFVRPLLLAQRARIHDVDLLGGEQSGQRFSFGQYYRHGDEGIMQADLFFRHPVFLDQLHAHGLGQGDQPVTDLEGASLPGTDHHGSQAAHATVGATRHDALDIVHDTDQWKIRKQAA